MGGKILEYEAKTIRNEALRQGREEGRRKGREEGRQRGIEEGIKGTVSVLKGLNIPASVILEKIQEQYHLSPEDCREYL
ncbi:hypothetical protein AALC25_03255 [Lachnospiraceae bacterium 29-84]